MWAITSGTLKFGHTQAQEGKPTRRRVDDSLNAMREIAEEKLQEAKKRKGYAMDEVASQAPNVSFEVREKCFKDFARGCVWNRLHSSSLEVSILNQKELVKLPIQRFYHADLFALG